MFDVRSDLNNGPLQKRVLVPPPIDARRRGVGGVAYALEMLRRATNLTRIHFTADHFSCMPYALPESVYPGFRGKVQIVVPNRNLLHALGGDGRPWAVGRERDSAARDVGNESSRKCRANA